MLWRANGRNVYERADLSSLALGLDVILCAPGPSLIPVERQPGILVCALTKAYPAIKPDLWIGMDRPECYDRRLVKEAFPKVFNFSMKDIKLGVGLLCYQPNVLFASLAKRADATAIFDDLKTLKDFVWKQNTLATALHILFWMGARRIFLNGFNLGAVNGKDYTDAARKVLTPQLRQMNQNLFDQQAHYLVKVAALAAKRGKRIVSCTPGSPINATIGYCDLKDALKAAALAVPDPGIVMHCMEVEDLKKKEADGKALPMTLDGVRRAIEKAKADRGKPKPPQFMPYAPMSADALNVVSKPIAAKVVGGRVTFG